MSRVNFKSRGCMLPKDRSSVESMRKLETNFVYEYRLTVGDFRLMSNP